MSYDISGFSDGPWTAYRMVHDERGDDLTPEELGEYVKNSVIKSAKASGSTAFCSSRARKVTVLLMCATSGMGPTSPANARLIAAAPDLFRENIDLRKSLADLLADWYQLAGDGVEVAPPDFIVRARRILGDEPKP